jgi:hypothetical protein
MPGGCRGGQRRAEMTTGNVPFFSAFFFGRHCHCSHQSHRSCAGRKIRKGGWRCRAPWPRVCHRGQYGEGGGMGSGSIVIIMVMPLSLCIQCHCRVYAVITVSCHRGMGKGHCHHHHNNKRRCCQAAKEKMWGERLAGGQRR